MRGRLRKSALAERPPHPTFSPEGGEERGPCPPHANALGTPGRVRVQGAHGRRLAPRHGRPRDAAARRAGRRRGGAARRLPGGLAAAAGRGARGAAAAAGDDRDPPRAGEGRPARAQARPGADRARPRLRRDDARPRRHPRRDLPGLRRPRHHHPGRAARRGRAAGRADRRGAVGRRHARPVPLHARDRDPARAADARDRRARRPPRADPRRRRLALGRDRPGRARARQRRPHARRHGDRVRSAPRRLPARRGGARGDRARRDRARPARPAAGRARRARSTRSRPTRPTRSPARPFFSAAPPRRSPATAPAIFSFTRWPGGAARRAAARHARSRLCGARRASGLQPLSRRERARQCRRPVRARAGARGRRPTCRRGAGRSTPPTSIRASGSMPARNAAPRPRLGENGAPATIAALKASGCAACGGKVFRRRAGESAPDADRANENRSCPHLARFSSPLRSFIASASQSLAQIPLHLGHPRR